MAMMTSLAYKKNRLKKFIPEYKVVSGSICVNGGQYGKENIGGR